MADTQTVIARAGEYRKAIAGFLVPALGALGVALEDGAITPTEWVAIGIAALGSSYAVARVENKRAAGD